MTTLKCSECGNEFNETEQACPNCGCPANECSAVEHIEKETEKETEKTDDSETKTTNHFTSNSLLPGETIVASAEWEVRPIMILLSIVAIIMWVLFIVFVSDYHTEVVASSIFLPAAIISSLGIVLAVLSSEYQEFIITNKRVIAYYGFILRAAFELKIEQVESITIYQGLFARLFHCGMVQVCGIGASKARILFVKNPFEFRQHFYDIQYAEKNNTMN